MIDHEKIEQAVRLLLEGMGEDVTRKALKIHRTELPECTRKFMAEWTKMQESIWQKHLP